MARHRIEVTLAVEIDIAEGADTIERVVENRDEDGVPQPVGKGKRGWQDVMYRLETAEEVLQHLAFNCVANGITDVARLDGWADLTDGQTTMWVDRASVDYWPSETVEGGE